MLITILLIEFWLIRSDLRHVISYRIEEALKKLKEMHDREMLKDANVNAV